MCFCFLINLNGFFRVFINLIQVFTISSKIHISFFLTLFFYLFFKVKFLDAVFARLNGFNSDEFKQVFDGFKFVDIILRNLQYFWENSSKEYPYYEKSELFKCNFSKYLLTSPTIAVRIKGASMLADIQGSLTKSIRFSHSESIRNESNSLTWLSKKVSFLNSIKPNLFYDTYNLIPPFTIVVLQLAVIGKQSCFRNNDRKSCDSQGV